MADFPFSKLPHNATALEDQRPAYSHLLLINLSNLHVDGVFLASELKLKAEFQEVEHHASPKVSMSNHVPRFTLAFRIPSPPTLLSLYSNFFPNLHRAIGGLSCPGVMADFPFSKLPHNATALEDPRPAYSRFIC